MKINSANSFEFQIPYVLCLLQIGNISNEICIFAFRVEPVEVPVTLFIVPFGSDFRITREINARDVHFENLLFADNLFTLCFLHGPVNRNFVRVLFAGSSFSFCVVA